MRITLALSSLRQAKLAEVLCRLRNHISLELHHHAAHRNGIPIPAQLEIEIDLRVGLQVII